jgi:hypothetical protein
MVDRRIAAADSGGGTVSVGRLLFAVLGAPVIWGLHLLLCYFLVTLECITAWRGAEAAVLAVTAVAVAGSVAAGRVAWKGWKDHSGGRLDPDEGEWVPFLLLAGVAASALFTLVVVTAGVAPLFVATCT